MKKWLIAVSVLCTCFMGCATTSNNRPMRIDEAPQSSSHRVNRGVFPFQGEILTFDARHVASKASIADAIVQVGYETKMEDGTRYIPIIGSASSKSIVRLFAKVDDRTEAYIDPETWDTIYSYKHLNENTRDREYYVWFWNDDDVASTERHTPQRVTKREFPVPPGTMDSIAWIYHVRKLDLEKGHTYIRYTFDGWTINRVELRIIDDEDVWTENGYISALKVEIWRERSDAQAPRGALSGVFIEPARKIQVPSYKLATAWLGTDELRTPIRMVVDTGIGEFDLILKSVGKLEK